MDIFNEKSLGCVGEFERAVKAHGDDEFDVYPIMTKISLDIICGNGYTIAQKLKQKQSTQQFNCSYLHGKTSRKGRGKGRLFRKPQSVSAHSVFDTFLTI